MSDRGETTRLRAEDLDDLATFFQMDRESCLRRLQGYDSTEVRDAWLRADPRTPQQIRDFYASTDLYIWELMQWHASPERDRYAEMIAYIKRRFPPATHLRVLDYGCGVGTDGLQFAQAGYEVHLADIRGVISDFAQHRFRRRKIEANLIPVTGSVAELRGKYDIILCCDVLEHVPNPVAVLEKLVSHMSGHGIAAVVATFDDAGGVRPCHLNSNIKSFGGVRAGHWEKLRNALGLERVDSEMPHVYRKVPYTRRLARRVRYRLWRATGIWICRVATNGFC